MKKIVLLLGLFTLISCNKTTVFTKTYEFENNRWQTSDVKTYEFDIKKDVQSADIDLKFSHVFDPQYNSVPLQVMIYHPDGTSDNVYLRLQLKDSDGNYISDCAGDMCDLTMHIKENMNMPKGKYKVTIENKFPQDYVPNVTALTLSVKHDE